MPQIPAIIPRPQQLILADGFFTLSQSTSIASHCEAATGALHWFIDALYRQSGVTLENSALENSTTGVANAIILREDNALAPESYALEITPDAIEISASGASGFLYGLVTLLQTIPFEEPSAPGAWLLPALHIADAPRFGWRGIMLDSARHFQPVSWIKKFVDLLALHKLNVLHWHLVDDQGWRIEILQYPQLTSVSAWRAQSRVGHEIGAAPDAFDGKPHGGFYSQAELREVVAYAAARGIAIVPEIEMPGHASSVVAAFPQLACAQGPFEVEKQWGVFDDVYCAGNDEVFEFMENVLDEVLAIFPSEFIHIGGDECPKTRWKACPKCQARIQGENLKDEDELQSWFVRHFDRFLTARGRRLIGWDEILEGGLAPDATVMSWRSEAGGIEAARAGHEVVMAPNQMTYLDAYQSDDKAAEPLAIGGHISLQQVYCYEPLPTALNADEAAKILGAQAQLWTEYMPSPQHVEYMAFPRACALAERLWSSPDCRDFGDFSARLPSHLRRLARLNVNYRALDS